MVIQHISFSCNIFLLTIPGYKKIFYAFMIPKKNSKSHCMNDYIFNLLLRKKLYKFIQQNRKARYIKLYPSVHTEKYFVDVDMSRQCPTQSPSFSSTKIRIRSTQVIINIRQSNIPHIFLTNTKSKTHFLCVYFDAFLYNNNIRKEKHST